MVGVLMVPRVSWGRNAAAFLPVGPPPPAPPGRTHPASPRPPQQAALEDAKNAGAREGALVAVAALCDQVRDCLGPGQLPPCIAPPSQQPTAVAPGGCQQLASDSARPGGGHRCRGSCGIAWGGQPAPPDRSPAPPPARSQVGRPAEPYVTPLLSQLLAALADKVAPVRDAAAAALVAFQVCVPPSPLFCPPAPRGWQGQVVCMLTCTAFMGSPRSTLRCRRLTPQQALHVRAARHSLEVASRGRWHSSAPRQRS
jgi:hypothetical protein